MTLEELWLLAAKDVLRHIQGNYVEQSIEKLLHKNHNDPELAFRNIDPWLSETMSSGYGHYNESYRLSCSGTVRGNRIEVWFSDNAWGKPDLIITWLELFKFVKDGKKRDFQLKMF